MEFYMEWSASPILFELGPLAIRWYGLMFVCAFLGGAEITKLIFKAEGRDIRDVESLTFYIMFGIIIGARLAHCLFYDPAYYLSHPLEIPMVWKGGLASHGGAVGMILGIYLYSKKHADQSLMWLLDRLTLAGCIGGAFVRFGNFFNSEILGHRTDFFLGIKFLRVDSMPRHPAQLYEACIYVLIFTALVLIYRHYKERLPAGRLLGVYLISVFTARILLEKVKENQSAFEDGMLLNMGQLLSLPFVLTGIFFLIKSMQKKA
jgi:prolipoprotein diacylglyceryl transferase